MPNVMSPRIVQVMIKVKELKESITFYEKAFEATFNEEISSFQFGTWPGNEFFLVTIADDDQHPGAPGSSRFGLLVENLDGAHQRALEAGAVEVYPPLEAPWKPRSSCVADPSGNRIDLYQS